MKDSTTHLAATTRTDVVAPRAGSRERDRSNPSLFDALRADPTLPIERVAREDIVRDLVRGSRRYLFPTIRVLTTAAIHLILFVKRILPFPVGSQKLLSIGTAWFGRHFVSAEAQRLLLRHFVIETNVLNFIARNSGGAVPECDLLPTRIEETGDWKGTNAVALHDANVMNLLIDLGETEGVDVATRRRLEDLDFSMIRIPALEVDETKIVFGFDLPSAIYISAFYIALFFDDRTIERAVNSFQLDESLMTALADMTGDATFRTWTPVKFPTWLGSPTGEPARDLHWHILVHEYAHHRLLALATEAERRRTAS